MDSGQDVGFSFDAVAFARRYTGFARMARLLQAAEAFKAANLGREREKALRACLEAAMAERDPVMLSRAGDALGEPVQASIVSECEARRKKQIDSFLARISEAKTSAVREDVRAALIESGEAQMSMGAYPPALKSFSAAKDFGSTEEHELAVHVNMLRASVCAKNFPNVPAYVERLSCSIPKISRKDPELARILEAKQNVALGLAALPKNSAAADFERPAEHFIKVTLDLGSSFSDVASCEDVAMYGVLCALASFDRIKIKAQVLGHPSFRSMLEFFPLGRKALNAFVDSEYAKLQRTLEVLRIHAQMDIYLNHLADRLFKKIRTRAFKQYIHPYSSLSLADMANAFGCTQDEIEAELRTFILQDDLEAKIDRETNFLFVCKRNPRKEAFQKVLESGNRFIQNFEGSLFRGDMKQKHMIHKDKGGGKRIVFSPEDGEMNLPDDAADFSHTAAP